KIVAEKWEKRITEGELVIVPSPYRALAEPIADYIESLQAEKPGSFVHIIMGHLVMESYLEQVLHQNSSYIFTLALSRLENVVVTTVPYHIHTNGDGKHEVSQQADTEEVSN